MSGGGQRLTIRDAPQIRWVWGAQSPTVLNLKWGQAVVPAAALAYTESRVFLAIPVEGPSVGVARKTRISVYASAATGTTAWPH